MKVIIIPIIFFSLLFNAQFDVLRNYQNLNSLTFLNPSFSGEYSSAFIMFNKNNFGNSQLFNLSYNSNLNGFNISHYNHAYRFDKFYNINTTSLQYARLLKLSRKINLRLGANLAQNSFPVNKLSTNEIEREVHFTSKLGVLIENKQFYFGASQLNIPITKWDNSLSKNILSLQTGIKFNIKENLLIPSIQFLKSKLGYSTFYNLNYRLKHLGLNLGYNNNSNLLFGISLKLQQFSFKYTYTYKSSKLYLGLYNDHNFQLNYRIHYRCKNSFINNFF